MIWLWIAGSRNVGQWLNMGSPMDQGARYMEGDPIDRLVLGTLMALALMVLFTNGGRSRFCYRRACRFFSFLLTVA